jgi:transporter family protein
MSYQVFGLIIFSVFFWGLAPIVEKTGFSQAQIDPLIALTIRVFATMLGLVIIILGMGKTQALIDVNPKAAFYFAMSGLLAGLLGTWTYLAALRLCEASRVVPISATYPLVTSLLSFFILKEDFSLTRVLGTILIVGGIWLIK